MFARSFLIPLVLGCLLVAGTLVPGHAQDAKLTTPARDITDAEISATMELVMQARPRAALGYLDSLQADCAGQPLYLITRGRVMIELIPPDDHKKDYTKEVSEPVLAVFEQVIASSSQRIDEEGDASPAHLYRGWAWMQKSHIHALGRSFYTAGRDAGKGKSDLEKYLAVAPDNASANGLLGAFLYFTDAIPGVIKMLSKLLFLPTGDRDRGLDMMHTAVREENPFGVDYTRLLNNVYVFFEGRYEEGLEGATGLVDRYPAYPRPVIALATAGPFDPRNYPAHTARVDRFVALHEKGKESDTGAANVVRSARAYSERLMGTSAGAIEQLEAILDDAPEHPDWTESFARFQLGQLYAGEGRFDEAREQLNLAIDDKRSDLFRDPAKKARDDLKKFGGTGRPQVEPSWIQAIYAGNTDAIAAAAEYWDAYVLDSVPTAFYAAECRLLLGQTGTAAELYEDVIRRKAPGWDHSWQLVACTRLAEIAAAAGDYTGAVEYQKRAMDFYQNEYRMDWMLEGRRQYFERLSQGDTHAPPPALLSLSQ